MYHFYFIMGFEVDYARLLETEARLLDGVMSQKRGSSALYGGVDSVYLNLVRQKELLKTPLNSKTSSIDSLLDDTPKVTKGIGSHNYLGNILPANSIYISENNYSVKPLNDDYNPIRITYH